MESTRARKALLPGCWIAAPPLPHRTSFSLGLVVLVVVLLLLLLLLLLLVDDGDGDGDGDGDDEEEVEFDVVVVVIQVVLAAIVVWLQFSSAEAFSPLPMLPWKVLWKPPSWTFIARCCITNSTRSVDKIVVVV